jgi:hypothetical protein
MQYFYVRKTFSILGVSSPTPTGSFLDTTNIRVGDYFLVTGDGANNKVYLRDSNSPITNSEVSPQPEINVDKVLSILDNTEWMRTGSTAYTQQAVLSVGAAILLAIEQYNEGVTRPKPLGLSNFPETIDELKILDYSSDDTAKGHLEDYYAALSTYYATPNTANATAVNNAAENVQNYILTETDYNKLASAVLNIQLYLKQYVEDEFVSVSQAIQDYIDGLSAYTSDPNALMIKSGTSQPAAVVGKYYIWFDTN